MGMLKGQKEYVKWEKGEKLTRKESMLAHCYQCNGFNDSRIDCKGKYYCPLYQFFYYKGIK